MDCCYFNDCEEFSTTPIIFTPCTPVKYSESTPVCIPCVPSCNKQQIFYCYEKPQQSLSRQKKVYCDSHCDDCDSCHPHSTQKARSQHKKCSDKHSQEYCPTCHQPTATPVKTKYIMPCYRYEDGRIEQYVPKVHGRLPTSAFRRNGVQDQIVGYRGAIRYLCAIRKHDKHYIYTSVDPIRRIYPKITQEMLPVKQTNKKC